jgi:DNA mismatch endonuclease, patch repair protein
MRRRDPMPDNLTIEQRSYTMSRIRSTNTKPELIVRRLAHARGLRFKIHQRSLRGCPDLVFSGAKVVVFIDGDFWHGWRFPLWRNKLSSYWKAKIARNRQRDRCNFRLLRRHGWHVIRIWEHQIKRDVNTCLDRIERAVRNCTSLSYDNSD